ncbi:MAG: NDP-sugar synthase [Candidatus Liptonbacteria bacterium]|nr:NDP-sugar synthase [Candidatus Liptonbacteria bacterium]
MQNQPIKQAVILSAGLGTHLRPLTDNIPKVMVPLGGKPLLEHHIEQFKKHGVTDFFINLHYLPDAITNYFGDGSQWGVKITYTLEKPDIRGTAGGMKNFEPYLHEPFFVIYGDMFSMLDYTAMANEFMRHPDNIGMMLIGPANHLHDSDLVEVDDKFDFVKLYLKPHSILPATEMTLLATYIFTPKILSYIPVNAYYEIDHQLLPDILAHGEKFSGYTSSDYILDIGTMERYQKVQEYLKSLKK